MGLVSDRAHAPETMTMSLENEGVLPPVAETNLALYRQLHALGDTHADLIRVRDGYELAPRLFGGICVAQVSHFLST